LDKNKEISLQDEIKLVQDYLDLEKIRYEERLTFEFIIADDVRTLAIPPFIIQAQVENAIKHGISKLPGKGLIKVEAFYVGSQLHIVVSNSGRINSESPLTGVGFVNSRQRLELLYGNQASITINEKDEMVIVEIRIPKPYR
jgi:LytS/YehU family sensor histidine kinase